MKDTKSKIFKTACLSAVAFSVFTALSYIFTFANISFVFSLSAFIPQYLLSFGQYASDMLSNPIHQTLFAILSSAFVLFLLTCSTLSIKFKNFLFPAFILITCDSVVMVFHFITNFELIASTNLISMLIHAFIHIWCNVYAFFGVIALKKSRSDEAPDPDDHR